jgi:hypothetical protein
VQGPPTRFPMEVTVGRIPLVRWQRLGTRWQNARTGQWVDMQEMERRLVADGQHASVVTDDLCLLCDPTAPRRGKGVVGPSDTIIFASDVEELRGWRAGQDLPAVPVVQAVGVAAATRRR